MTYNLYSVHDIYTGYNLPFYDSSDGAARRAYETAIEDNAVMATHRDDYQLRKLGTFDSDTGIIKSMEIEVIA